jgi:hypothetical protein
VNATPVGPGEILVNMVVLLYVWKVVRIDLMVWVMIQKRCRP